MDDRNESAATFLYHGSTTPTCGDATKSRNKYVVFFNLVGFGRTYDFRISGESVKSGRVSVKKTLHSESFAVTDSFTGGRKHLASEAARTYNHQIFHERHFIYQR